MKGNYRLKTISVVMLALPFATASFADVILDGTMGSTDTIDGPDYVIEEGVGRTSGNNLFHSFSEFDLLQSESATFNGSPNIENIISRITDDNPSSIDGAINSNIVGANLYFLNPNGIMFGANASINITGSFYASTANYITDASGAKFSTDINEGLTLFSAAPSEFGFTTDTPAEIKVIGSTLSVDDGQTLALIGGNIILDDGAYLEAADGTINIASVGAALNGIVTVTADTIEMSGFTDLGNITLSNSSEISTSGESAGHIVIRGGTLTFNNGSKISANSDGSGSNNYSENIDIVAATTITLNNMSSITNDVGSLSSADTKGIVLTITDLTAGQLNLNSGSTITSNTAEDSSGNSGGINIDSNELTISDHSAISVSTDGTGNAGDIDIDSNNIDIKDGGRITTSSQSAGNTGNIDIVSNKMTITGPEISGDPFGTDFTGISSTKNFTASSEGGDITININNGGDLTLDRRAKIVTTNLGAADGGVITITNEFGSVNIRGGSQLVSNAQGALSGNGGKLNITADTLNIVGNYNASDDSIIQIDGPESLRPTPTGDTGNLDINVGSLNILDGGGIRSRSYNSTGASGSIDIQATDIHISGLNIEKKKALIAQGKSVEYAINQASSHIVGMSFFKSRRGATPSSIGTLSINTESMFMDSNTYISTQTMGSANSHDINIVASKNLTLKSGAYLTSASLGLGNAGNITITAGTIDIDGQGGLSQGTGIYSKSNEFLSNTSGGNISIQSDRLNLKNGAIITSETSLAGDGGDININSTEFVQLSNGSMITTKASDQSTGNAGNININTALFVLNSSEITTTAVKGQGGDINITADNLLITTDSVIDAASEQSVDGVINITNNADVVSSLVKLTEESSDVVSQFKGECSTDTTSDSRFSVTNSLLLSNSVALSPSNYSGGQIDSTGTSHTKAPVKSNQENLRGKISPLNQIAWALTGNCR